MVCGFTATSRNVVGLPDTSPETSALMQRTKHPGPNSRQIRPMLASTSLLVMTPFIKLPPSDRQALQRPCRPLGDASHPHTAEENAWIRLEGDGHVPANRAPASTPRRAG